MLNAAFTDGSGRVRHPARMRMKSFAWLVAVILLVFLVVLVVDRQGGDLSSLAEWIHGR
jgi:hypothetical protein